MFYNISFILSNTFNHMVSYVKKNKNHMVSQLRQDEKEKHYVMNKIFQRGTRIGLACVQIGTKSCQSQHDPE